MSDIPAPQPADPKVLYRERQWVPWYFWIFAAIVVALTSATAGLNRSVWWTIIPAVLLGAIAIWVLITWSGTVVQVEQDEDGTRWLLVKDAQLPNEVVSRSITVPKSARHNALGPQFDPAAFLVSHAWIDEHAMMVLNDPEDDTPYWLIASKDPDQLLRAFLPEQHA
ncbi:DUF3093 domain-containing protein [Corynebacterium accolens]|nr:MULTISPECIES: DUF3093 domain-containing protein [Corynebacterium]MCT1408797.1 DUF3093 domain-containing protein [Corynebacterium accolens]MDK4244192.1 DUF3093 domain-containing protein [Corynebacterium accolens]MDK4261124.1 DUF3093 domain-containing protein [Corynebacterium accolens]MDK4262999.1 DUF3093 domain-containing protein [Corynebacterium accolens]MDK4271105.1 DUF3093 domain-containing protein [Corynebacterium accolens]